jgi:thiamine-phosphate pyrophosphorylase
LRTRAGDRLFREAAKLGARRPARKRLPPLFFVTDPSRTPDPVAVAAALPRGAGVIYRHFGAADAGRIAAGLARVARARGLVLLIGADARLAAKVGADGVHLPERELGRARRLRRPNWILTGAAHSGRALALAGRAGLDAALLSPALPSRSPSAGRPLGPIRLARLVRGARLPVYALGGVNAGTAKRLRDTGISGLAAVEGLGGP